MSGSRAPAHVEASSCKDELDLGYLIACAPAKHADIRMAMYCPLLTPSTFPPSKMVSKHVGHLPTRVHPCTQLDPGEGVVKVPHRIALGIALGLAEAVAHEREPVVRPVVDVVVLPPHVLEHLEPVQSRAGVNSCHGPVNLAVLEPRPTGYGAS